MICPLSEKRSRGVRLGFGMQPNVYQLRDGADDEDSRSAVTRHGEEDHVVASSRDHRGQRTHDAALAGAAGTARLVRIERSAQRLGESDACAAGDVRTAAGLVPGTLLRPKHAAFPRETAGGTWDRVELHLGAEGATRSGPGGQAK